MMTLLSAPTSPYVRKVMVVAHETGQIDRIDPVFALANPTKANEELNNQNPLAKIPALVTEDGAIFDSRVICEYLDATTSTHPLFPRDGKTRWQALTQQALADGLLDAALSARYELLMRPEDKQWSGWRDAQLAKIERALDRMNTDIPDTLTIGAVGYGCALGYLDFRFPEVDWRAARPALADWFATFSERPSMQATLPRD